MRQFRTHYPQAVVAFFLLLASWVGAAAQTGPSFIPGCVFNNTPPSLSDKQIIAWQCDSSGRLITTGGGGGGGSPGGSSGTVQYNAAGSFGGISGWTTNGTTTFVGGASTTLAIGGGTALTTSNQTGTGSIVLATSPTLVTPALGVATATSLAVAGCTLGTDEFCVTGQATISSTLTLSSISGSTQCLHVDTNGVVSGTGSDCGSGGSGITIGTTTITSGTATRVLYETSGNKVGEISGATSDGTTLTLVAPVLGAATATSINKVAITAPATSATLTIPDGVTLTGPASSGTAMTLGNAETVTGVKTFTAAAPQIILGVNTTTLGSIKLFGSTSGDVTVKAAAVAGTATVFQLPPTNGSNTNVLQTDGSGVTSWVAAGGGGGSPGGSDTQVQFNDSSAFGGDAGLTYVKATDTLTVAGAVNTGSSVTGLVLNGTTTAAQINFKPSGGSEWFMGAAGSGSGGGTNFSLYNLTDNFTPFFVQGTGATLAGVFTSRDSSIGWSSTGFVDTVDSNISRNAAGIVQFGTTAANASGAWLAAKGFLGATTNAILTGPATATLQLGNTDVDLNSNVVAQTLRTQGPLAGGTTNQAGKDFTILVSPGKGTGVGGSFIVQTTPAGGSGTSINAGVTALSITGSGLISYPTITTDATHTTSTVCQDTTTHALYFGSGTVGICLGTSSLRFKHDVGGLQAGLAEIAALEPIHYRYNKGYGDENKVLYGFAAEQVANVLPGLVGLDTEARPNSVDWAGIVPVIVNAIKELKADNDNLRERLRKLGG